MRGQLAFKLKAKPSHGGLRKGAGRPNRSGLKPHIRREDFSERHPLHVTLRLQDSMPSLRRKDVFKTLRLAVAKGRLRGLRIVHFSILSNHLHLIVESESKTHLGRVMQSFALSFSKRLNALLDKSGPVFSGRYDLHVLKTPTEVRNALRYVLLNRSLHEKRSNPAAPLRIEVGPFSNAWSFENWRELRGKDKLSFEDTLWPEDKLESWLSQMIASPRTWMLKTGWLRATSQIA